MTSGGDAPLQCPNLEAFGWRIYHTIQSRALSFSSHPIASAAASIPSEDGTRFVRLTSRNHPSYEMRFSFRGRWYQLVANDNRTDAVGECKTRDDDACLSRFYNPFAVQVLVYAADGERRGPQIGTVYDNGTVRFDAGDRCLTSAALSYAVHDLLGIPDGDRRCDQALQVAECADAKPR